MRSGQMAMMGRATVRDVALPEHAGRVSMTVVRDTWLAVGHYVKAEDEVVGG